MGTIDSPVPEVEQVEKPTGLMTSVALLRLIVALLSLLLFSWMATEVREGDTANFDLSIRMRVHQFFTPTLTRTMVIVSQLGANVLVGAFLVLLIVFRFLRWRRGALWLVITM